MIIDLTFDIDNEMLTCGTKWHQTVEISRLGTIDTVGRNTSKIVIGSHSGTHMDSSLHFIEGSYDISKMNLDMLCGDITIIDFTRFKKGDVIERKDVLDIPISKRMLFRFDWFKKWKTNDYYNGFPYFSEEAIKYLFDAGMRLMALDTPSPDDGGAICRTGDEDSPNHKFLLKNDVVIIEYLCDTDKLVMDKHYEIIALPLKIRDCDGSPCRVIAREI